MKSSEIRSSFLDYFRSKGHTVVPSSPLVPANDPTLLFTNSGMVQFKDVFLGIDKRPYVRADDRRSAACAPAASTTTSRTSATPRATTRSSRCSATSASATTSSSDAIHFAWELLTKVYKLPPDKLWATVYHDDDEAYDIWTKDDRRADGARACASATSQGGAKYQSDNFWQMGDTGPCGPCSEIFYDHGPGIAGGPPGSPDADGDRYIEIWNLVFMQFNRDDAGRACIRCPSRRVDTGMGLERIAAVLQHVHSNYEIDLFQDLIKRRGARDAARRTSTNPSLRRDRRPHPRLRVPDRRRRDPRQRGPRLRAAPDHPPRDPPRLQARAASSRSSTGWCADLDRARWATPIRSCARRKARVADSAASRKRSASPRRSRTAWRSSRRRSPRARSCSTATPRSSSTTPTASRWTSPPTSAASAA